MNNYKLGQTIKNPVDAKDRGQYLITQVKRLSGHWLYTAYPINPLCSYASIGGSL